MRNECVYGKGGFCHHYGRVRKCRPSDGSWFNYAKPIIQLHMDQICEYQNPLLTDYLTVSPDDIEALKQGKILFRKLGSETIFIALKGDDNGLDTDFV